MRQIVAWVEFSEIYAPGNSIDGIRELLNLLMCT